jgi:hypothetical protein
MTRPETPGPGPTPILKTAFGTAALVLGILGAALGLVTPAFLFIIPMGLGILAVTFGTIAVYRVVKHRAGDRAVSILGLILGALALLLGIWGFVKVQKAADELNHIGSSLATTPPATATPFTPTPATPAPQAPGTQRPTTGSSPATDPTTVVGAYFAAINAHDYQGAYRLGGKNLEPSYARFAAGFADTAGDIWTTLSVNGDRVTGQLEAVHTDGSVTYYSGYYIVSGDIITEAHLGRA